MYSNANSRSKMWLLLTLASLTSVLGTTHGFFGKVNPGSPEVTMNISQMISYWGYPNEKYEVVTEDGYILEVDRIPYGKINSGNRDAGYDVWLGNSRGNTWARKNLYYSPDSVEFWAFSFDEMAKYDLPATIDFIVNKTGQKQLHYVGHSQGTTIGFIAFSTNPKLAERIKTFYALAPVATVKYTKSLLNKLRFVPSFLFKMIFGDKLFLPHNFFDQFLATEVCSRETLNRVCSNALFIFCGFDSKNFNTSRLDVYLSHNPAGTSVQNIFHWTQAVKSGKFQAYDWGSPAQNMMHYNQPKPPYYNVTAMNVPIAVWNGGNDLLADPQDVGILLPKLPNLIYHKEIPFYNHLDFIWAMDAPQEVYNEIVSMMSDNKK
ncbi:gastric triacylglycerol lipase isoform X3 [Cebus imitator]|uniref:gastric triacylglycerol lipase isoform X3 n=1 Tax=Cebus imitator TaxID=2715852 RepID=UPI000809F6CB|nr:gastric triacylglycerol lipase isoform X3 [Cebus imitator]